jgi:hypothetical protein
MPPTNAQQVHLKELAAHFSRFVEELSALERTINWYAWSLDQERQEIALLSSKIAMLEVALLPQNARSVQPIAALA